MARKSQGKKAQVRDTTMQKKQALTSLYFNRFLMIRYFLAIFVFANFFWAYLAWGHWSAWIPSILLLLSILPCFQMGFMFGKGEVEVKATEWFYRIQWVVCIAMMILAWTAPLNQIWPMFREGTLPRAIVFGIFLIGFLLSSLVLRKFYLINHNLDKQYGRIQFYETKYKIKLDR